MPWSHAARLERSASTSASPYARWRGAAVSTGHHFRLRADAGYFAGQLARAALFADIEADIEFEIGARRIAPLWRLLEAETDVEIVGEAGEGGVESQAQLVAAADALITEQVRSGLVVDNQDRCHAASPSLASIW